MRFVVVAIFVCLASSCSPHQQVVPDAGVAENAADAGLVDLVDSGRHVLLDAGPPPCPSNRFQNPEGRPCALEGQICGGESCFEPGAACPFIQCVEGKWQPLTVDGGIDAGPLDGGPFGGDSGARDAGAADGGVAP